MSGNRGPAGALGAEPFLDDFLAWLDSWKDKTVPGGIREIIHHQFTGESKFFRPLTIFACAKAAKLIDGWTPQKHATGAVARTQEAILRRAHVIEMIHNVTLIMDDVVDRSPQRRGQLVPHSRCAPLTAFMVSGYLIAESFELLSEGWLLEGVDEGRPDARAASLQDDVGNLVRRHGWTLPSGAGDAAGTIEKLFLSRERLTYLWTMTESARGTGLFDHRLIAELLKRLAVVECLQWDFRQDGALVGARRKNDGALGLADWYFLAREDTGSMFEICACMGAQSQQFRRFGRLLGILYHGADDVSDLEESQDLGGGGDADVHDRILTLPAALALQAGDERFRERFGRWKQRRNLEKALFGAGGASSAARQRDLEVMTRALYSLSAETRTFLSTQDWWKAWVPKDDDVRSKDDGDVRRRLGEQLPEARAELSKIRAMAESEIDRVSPCADRGVLARLVGEVHKLSH